MNEIERQLIEKYEAEGFGAAKKFYKSNQNKINNLEKRDSLLVTSQMLRMCALNNDNEFAETITKPNSTNNGGDDMKCICVKNWKKVRCISTDYDRNSKFYIGDDYSGILQLSNIDRIEKFNGLTNTNPKGFASPRFIETKDWYMISLTFYGSNGYIFSWDSESERDAVYDKLVKFLNCETF